MDHAETYYSFVQIFIDILIFPNVIRAYSLLAAAC